MKILFVTEYFYPYIHGGAELSVHQLAKKINAVVLTPKYGKAKNLDDIEVERFPWPVKLNEFSAQLSPLFFANPLTWLYLSIIIIWKNQKIKADIFHGQSVNSFPGVWIAARLLGKKCVLNIRDNQILCNYGWCLSNDKEKVCNLKSYFLDDFKHYYQDKVKNKNLLTLAVNILFAVNGRLKCQILKFFANLADERICASYAQQKVLGLNGIRSKVIYNIFEFSEIDLKPKAKNIILFASKLSEGKGLGLLIRSWPEVIKRYKNITLKIVGNGDTIFYKKLADSCSVSDSIVFEPMPDFTTVSDIRKTILLEVTPSIYPESFGRAALESIALGVPVVATNRGGLSEIVEDNVTGYVVEPNTISLSTAIIKAIKNNLLLRKNIVRKYTLLRNKFEKQPVLQYLSLYKGLL